MLKRDKQMNITAKLPVVTAPLVAALSLTGVATLAAPAAHAYTAAQDAEYVMLLTQAGQFNRAGPSAEAAFGRLIANDIASCLRDPLQERNWVYNHTDDSIGVINANQLVNFATEVYLGFGPPYLPAGCGYTSPGIDVGL
jgi:hypothetical protein